MFDNAGATPGHGAAGRRGDDVRSDLWVELEPANRGGIDVELHSRVEPYYGESIRDQLRRGLESMGVEHARVKVEDQGALPYVIDARLEAAVVDAGLSPKAEAIPTSSVVSSAPSKRDRLRRSRLYLPGNEPKYFIGAGLHAPDGIILDLEDSVHPDHKAAARLLVRNALGCVDFGAAERMVRINQLPLGLEDLAAVVPRRPDMILIPKVEHAEQVREVAGEIDRLLGAADRPLWLMPIVESALGVENSLAIAGAGERVAAITLGLEDYAADLGLPKSVGGDESVYARLRVVNAARAAGIQAIDSVYGQVDDLDGLRRWGSQSRRLGFVGMGCVHPRQIRPIHEVFSPSRAEIDKALRIVEAFEKARAAGLGVVSLGSKMIDPPVIEQARRIVAQARKLGLEDDEGASA